MKKVLMFAAILTVSATHVQAAVFNLAQEAEISPDYLFGRTTTPIRRTLR